MIFRTVDLRPRLLHEAVEVRDGVLHHPALNRVGLIKAPRVAPDEDEAVLVVIVGFPLHVFSGLAQQLVVEPENRLVVVLLLALIIGWGITLVLRPLIKGKANRTTEAGNDK